jgi:hypothetical protein
MRPVVGERRASISGQQRRMRSGCDQWRASLRRQADIGRRRRQNGGRAPQKLVKALGDPVGRGGE